MSQQTELEQLRDQKLADTLQQIQEQLSLASATDTATLSERVFSNVFLPLFAGDETLVYKADFATWINYAGGPYRSVDIIDTSGKVLFTVPPLFDRKAVNPVSTSAIPISHVVATANQYAKLHPSQGMLYLDAELTKRAIVMKVPANVIENLELWNNIFMRYNRPPIMTVDIKQAGGTSDTGDTLDYELEPL